MDLTRAVPFNRPYLSGKESLYIQEALSLRKLSGDGVFTRRCHAELERMLGRGRTLLTTSCTDALEAAAILCDIKPGDEVIVPSFTFVSTANAFVLRGARIRFVDCMSTHPNIDHNRVEELITKRTKVIVPVHYAGISCEMDVLRSIATKYDLWLVEDAAQAIASKFREEPLGTIGHLAAFSFHETKNIISGEGGALHINDKTLFERAEIIREKGTNRSAFFRGEIDKYGWVDIGSSYLPSDLIAAFLLAQLESIEEIQSRRLAIWNTYHSRLHLLQKEGKVQLPFIPEYAMNNAHMFYLVCESLAVRSDLIQYLKNKGIGAVFHYQSLHSSKYFAERHDSRRLPESDRFTDCLVRLPLYADLTLDNVCWVSDQILNFFSKS